MEHGLLSRAEHGRCVRSSRSLRWHAVAEVSLPPPPPPTRHPLGPAFGGLEGTLGREGSDRGAGLAGAGGVAGAAEGAAPARAHGECVFAIISIITTS